MSHDAVTVERCTAASIEAWAFLRGALWPDTQHAEHRQEVLDILESPATGVAFLALTGAAAAGFVEATLRHGYVNGCTTSPVAFVEGIYVAPEHRRRGVARRLFQAVEGWAREQGCLELASDTELHNGASQSMHRAVGFEETERVVYFRKPLGTRP